jgi:hypothetical protein
MNSSIRNLTTFVTTRVGNGRPLSLLRGMRQLCLRPVLLGLLMATIGLTEASAGSIPYSLNFFVLTNSNADGTAVSPDGGISIVITGGNNGSGLSGFTDLLATATKSGAIPFQYTYSSADAPGFDWAGYVIGTQFTRLADTDGQTGFATLLVSAGQTFGFRVETDDNTGEPGVFKVSDSTVPEPSSLILAMGGMLGLVVARHCRSIAPAVLEDRR